MGKRKEEMDVKEKAATVANFYNIGTGYEKVGFGFDKQSYNKLAVISSAYDKAKAETIRENFKTLFVKHGIEAEVDVRESTRSKGKFRAVVRNADEVVKAINQKRKTHGSLQDAVGDAQPKGEDIDHLTVEKAEQALKEAKEAEAKDSHEDKQPASSEQAESKRERNTENIIKQREEILKRAKERELKQKATTFANYYRTGTGETEIFAPDNRTYEGELAVISYKAYDDKAKAETISSRFKDLFQKDGIKADVGVRQSEITGKFRAVVKNADEVVKAINQKVRTHAPLEEAVGSAQPKDSDEDKQRASSIQEESQRERNTEKQTKKDIQRENQQKEFNSKSKQDRKERQKKPSNNSYEKSEHLGPSSFQTIRDALDKLGKQQRAEAKDLHENLSSASGDVSRVSAAQTESDPIQSALDQLQKDGAMMSSNDLYAKKAIKELHKECVEINKDFSNGRLNTTEAVEIVDAAVENAANKVDSSWKGYLKNFARKLTDAIKGIGKQEEKTNQPPEPENKGSGPGGSGPGL